jgi:hypothetical protein
VADFIPTGPIVQLSPLAIIMVMRPRYGFSAAGSLLSFRLHSPEIIMASDEPARPAERNEVFVFPMLTNVK